MFVKTRLCTSVVCKIEYTLTDMIKQLRQQFDMDIKILGQNPLNSVSVSATSVDFGVLPELCSQDKSIIITNVGSPAVPLRFSVTQGCNDTDVKSFTFMLSDGKQKLKSSCYLLKPGEKVTANILFDSPELTQEQCGKITKMECYFVVELDVDSDEGDLYRIPLRGHVAHSKFLCLSSHNPIVLHSPMIGQSVTCNFPLKNVGSSTLTLSCCVQSKDGSKCPSDLFVVPSTVTLPLGQVTTLPIKFTANTTLHVTDRVLVLRMKPNGKRVFNLDLHGVVTEADDRPCSRTSNNSGVTSVSAKSHEPEQAIKIATSKRCVSWPCVNIKKDLVQSVQIKNSSNVKAVLRISFKNDSDEFHFVTEKGEYLNKLKKPLKPGCVHELKILFRPQVIGPHLNQIHVETNSLSKKSMILLNAYGGSSKLVLQNTSTDSNGHKLIRLLPHSDESQYFHCEFVVANVGNIPGFIYIKPTRKVPSLTNTMKVTPSCVVIQPGSNYKFKVNQKLKRDEVKSLMRGCDIAHVETLSVLMGDEINRLRLKKCVQSGFLAADELITSLISSFIGEISGGCDTFEDEKEFRSVFFKSLKYVDVSAVIESEIDNDSLESTIIENGNDTTIMFTSMLNAPDSTLLPLPQRHQRIPPVPAPISRREDNTKNKLISKWLNDIDKNRP